jgi:hypothetical protein
MEKKLSWQENRERVPAHGLPDYNKASGSDVEAQFRDWVRIDESDDSEIPDAADAVIEKCKSDLYKSGVADAPWNAPLNSVCDAPWDQPIGKAAFWPERSRARFARVSESLRKVFKDSPEEFDEALALCKRVLDEERAAVLLGTVGEESGVLLRKSAVSSEMLSTLAAFRRYCTSQEIELLEKAVKALDLPAFFEIARGIIQRQAA